MASRAVHSQQTFVTVQVMSRLSIPQLRNRASTSDEPYDARLIKKCYFLHKPIGVPSSNMAGVVP
jgi:hypothetical protein